MDLSELLNSPMGQSIVKSVAGQFGMNEKEASGVVNMAVPAILAGMTRNAQSRDGDGNPLNDILGGFLRGR